MQGLVIHGANDLRIEDLPTPELGAGQLRVRVRCGGICGSDLHIYLGSMPGMQVGGWGEQAHQGACVLKQRRA